MFISLSGGSTEKAIEEYRDSSSYSTNNSTSHSSSEGNSTDEGYTFGVPSFTLEVIQEQVRKASGSQAGMSSNVPSSSPLDEMEVTIYSCAIDIPSKIDEQRLNNIKKWYQILDKLNPRLPVRGEWCCNPHLGISVYKAYFLGGLRLPLNAFARELLVRLGLGVCQFNPNAWRLIVSMQVLWREVFGGDRPFTMDDFLYCQKPSEIHQSFGFYQFTARGKDCRFIKSLASSDRNWKKEFFFVSGFWARKHMDVGRDICGHYTGDLGNLRPEGKSLPFLFILFSFFHIITFSYLFTYSCWMTVLKQILS